MRRRAPGGIRNLPLDRIVPNPEQPRVTFIQETIDELAASIREHGVLQPVLVRPLGPGQFQLVAGERRWRASQVAGLRTIPAMIEEIDDETALEIAIIENLQREDLSPLDEATMYDKMIREHGYSIRKLAEKLGKDKGYLENRLRLADAPPEVRELVSLRKDTLSHAYELLKIADPKKRRRLAEQVARGELSLVKLRERVEGRRTRAVVEPLEERGRARAGGTGPRAADAGRVTRSGAPLTDESLVSAKRQLSDSIEELIGVLQSPDVLDTIGGDGPLEPGEVPHDRQAAPRERDRDGPQRRAARVRVGQPCRGTAASHTAASSPIATAWTSQPR